MYSNNIVNFQESTTILITRTKKSGNLLYTPRMPRKEGKRGLANIEDGVDTSIRGLVDYIKMGKERLITAVSNGTDNIRTSGKTIKLRNRN